MAINAGDAIWKISGDIGDLQSALSEATSAVQSTTSEAESAATIAISGDSAELESTLDSVASDVSSTISDASGDATVEVSGDSTDLDTTLESVAGNVSSIVEDASGNAVVTVAGDTGELDSTLESVASSVSSTVEDASGNAVVTVAGDTGELDSTLESVASSVSSTVEDATGEAVIEVTADATDAESTLEGVAETAASTVQGVDATIAIEADASQAEGELASVAAAAAAAAADAESAFPVEADIDTSNAEQSLDNLTQKAAMSASDIAGHLSTIGTGMTVVGGVITGALGGMLWKWTEYGSEIKDASDRTGVATEALSELKFVLEQNGTELSAFEMAQRNLTRALVESQTEGSNYAETLGRLGLTYQSLQGLTPDEQFKRVAFAIGEAGDYTTQASLAMELFGARVATQLMPTILSGQAGFEELAAKARELGIVMSEEAAGQAEAFGDTVDQLKASFMGVIIQMGPVIEKLIKELIPALISGAEGVANFIKDHPVLIENLTKIALGVGGVNLAFGPLLQTLPGIVSLFLSFKTMTALTGLAAATAAPQIASVGTAAATAAGATGVGALVAGLAAIAWPVAAGVAIVAGVAAIAYSVSATKKAFDDLEVSEQKSAAMGERYAQHLRDKGIAFNEAAMAAMNLSERVKYGAEAEKQAADISARAWFEHFAGRAETEKEFANMRALLLNKNISAEQAAIAVSKGMNEAAIQELMRADAQKTEQILNSMGVLVTASATSIAEITDAELQGAAERNSIWMRSTEQLILSEQQKAQQVAGFWSTTFGEILRGIAALPVVAGDWMRGIVGVQPLAAGGPVAANTPYLVGECGPELFQPSVSGRIFNHGETMGVLAGAGAGGITVNMNGVNISSNMDVDAVARRLGDKLRQRITGVGASNNWRR